LIKYEDAYALVKLYIDKLEKPRETAYGDICLIVSSHCGGRNDAGVRYFEAKRKYLKENRYRAFDLSQIEHIYTNTRHVSMLAYDPDCHKGGSCTDVSFEHFLTSDFKLRNVNHTILAVGRPFSEKLVRSYFRLEEMDRSDDAVADAADHATKLLELHSEKILAVHATVTFGDSRKQAIELEIKHRLELESLIGKSVSAAKSIEESVNISKDVNISKSVSKGMQI